MNSNTIISLDNKIEDLFTSQHFMKFSEYCKQNDIIYLRQIESVDFIMFKSSFGVSDEEKNHVRDYWKTLINNIHGVSTYNDTYYETDTRGDQICIPDINQGDQAVVSVQADNLNDHKSYKKSTVESLLMRFEKYYSVSKSYISADSCDRPILWKGLSDEEYQIINREPNLFYKCTAKRFVLVKWIVAEIEKLFINNDVLFININTIYGYLGKIFGVVSFNRENLRKLLRTNDSIEYSEFIKIRDEYLNDYYKAISLEKSQCNNYQKNEINKTSRQIVLTSKLKGLINSIFEEDIFDPSSADEQHENCCSQEVFNKLCSAKEDLGKDICVEYIKDIERTINISTMIDTYCSLKEESILIQSKVAQSVSLINIRNYSANVTQLIKATKISNLSKENITLLFNKAKIRNVSEIGRLFSFALTNSDYLPLINFLNWLSQDLRQLVLEELTKLIKSDRDEIIVKRRACGATLEEIGKEFGITRERIRQIEKKFHSKFSSYISRLNPHIILNAFSQNNSYIKIDDVVEVYGEMSDIFIYCLKECNCATALWIEQLQGFVVGDVSWYELMKERLEDLPEMVELSAVDLLVTNISESTNSPLDHSSIKNLILGEYKLSGQVYHRKRMRSFEIYLAVIEKYYYEGIKLYDAFETKRFRGYVKEMFGDISLPDNNRAIDSVIGRITVLCDRGKYTLPSRISVANDLLEKIRSYINESDRNIIMFAELFERFRNELAEESNITNRYFLQGVLRYYYPNDYFYTRDILSKDSNNEASIRIAIEEFVKQESRIVTKEDLKEEFTGITDAILINAVITTHDLLIWEFGQYIHSSLLNIVEEDYQSIGDIVERQITNGFITTRKLFDILYAINADFMARNNIQTHTFLFSVIMYMYPEKYDYRRPYISQKGSPSQTIYDLLKDYLGDKESFKISEIRAFCDEMQIKILTIESLIERLGDEFIRIDSDVCMRKSVIDLSDELIEMIDDVTTSLMMKECYISLRKINDFFYYPYIGVEWTQFLLESIIREYSKKYKIVELDYRDHRYVSGIIVERGCGINTFEEILRYALKKECENTPFRTIAEVERWLKEQELIIKSIPQSLIDRGVVNQSGYGGIFIR